MASIKDLITSPAPDSVKVSRPILDQARRTQLSCYPSPDDWQDETLYVLLPDRFSDAKNRPMLTRDEIRSLRAASSRPGWNWRNWADSGRLWQGGTIAGIAQRLSYLQDLGISAIWIGSLLKQRNHLDTCHGYGIQDFLDVDPRFGTREDLLDLVQAAHGKGIRVILDIILNHTADARSYLQPEKKHSAIATSTGLPSPISMGSAWIRSSIWSWRAPATSPARSGSSRKPSANATS
jgi:hypothetical protein